jgi:hypothetical protein
MTGPRFTKKKLDALISRRYGSVKVEGRRERADVGRGD